MNMFTLYVVDPEVKRRRYHAPHRDEAAAGTRQAILAAARIEFLRHGYAATTVAGIARAAGVAVDTVYASVGRKPALFRLLIETSISGQDETIPAPEREYIEQIRSAATADEKLQIYAATVAAIQQHLAPLFRALREAAPTHPELAALWSEIAAQRANSMHELAVDLTATGQLRPDLSTDEVADVLWSMNAAEYYVLLVDDRGWSPDRFGRWLADAWHRLLVESRPQAPP
jgi:AcrR family transcriptional regulator